MGNNLLLISALFVAQTLQAGILSPKTTFSDMRGTKGTVICFHGSGGSSKGWTKDDDNGDYVKALIASGFSVVAPSSKGRGWNNTNSNRNVDIKALDKTLKDLKARPPYFLVGHSNGGGFVTRYAVYGAYKPKAVQYSNSSGIERLLKSSAYTVPSYFFYSPDDPVVNYKDVEDALNILNQRDVPIEWEDITLLYEYGWGYKSYHEFVDVSEYVIPWFLSFLQP